MFSVCVEKEKQQQQQTTQQSNEGLIGWIMAIRTISVNAISDFFFKFCTDHQKVSHQIIENTI